MNSKQNFTFLKSIIALMVLVLYSGDSWSQEWSQKWTERWNQSWNVIDNGTYDRSMWVASYDSSGGYHPDPTPTPTPTPRPTATPTPTPRPTPTPVPSPTPTTVNCKCYLIPWTEAAPNREADLYQDGVVGGGDYVKKVMTFMEFSSAFYGSVDCSDRCEGPLTSSGNAFYNGIPCNSTLNYKSVGYNNGVLSGSVQTTQLTSSHCSTINGHSSTATYPAPDCLGGIPSSYSTMQTPNPDASFTKIGSASNSYTSAWVCNYGNTLSNQTACISGDGAPGENNQCSKVIDSIVVPGDLTIIRRYTPNPNAIPDPASCSCYMLKNTPTENPVESALYATGSSIGNIDRVTSNVQAIHFKPDNATNPEACNSYCGQVASYYWTFVDPRECDSGEMDVYPYFNQNWTNHTISEFVISCSMTNYNTKPSCPVRPDGLSTTLSPTEAVQMSYSLVGMASTNGWICDLGTRSGSSSCFGDHATATYDGETYCTWFDSILGVTSRYKTLESACPPIDGLQSSVTLAGTTPTPAGRIINNVTNYTCDYEQSTNFTSCSCATGFSQDVDGRCLKEETIDGNVFKSIFTPAALSCPQNVGLYTYVIPTAVQVDGSSFLCYYGYLSPRYQSDNPPTVDGTPIIDGEGNLTGQVFTEVPPCRTSDGFASVEESATERTCEKTQQNYASSCGGPNTLSLIRRYKRSKDPNNDPASVANTTTCPPPSTEFTDWYEGARVSGLHCLLGNALTHDECTERGGSILDNRYCRYQNDSRYYFLHPYAGEEVVTAQLTATCEAIGLNTSITSTGSLPTPVMDPTTASNDKPLYTCDFGTSADSSSCSCITGFSDQGDFKCKKLENATTYFRESIYQREVSKPSCPSIADRITTNVTNPIATWDQTQGVWICNYGTPTVLTTNSEACLNDFPADGYLCKKVTNTEVTNCISGATPVSQEVHQIYNTSNIDCPVISVSTSIATPLPIVSGNDFICNYGMENAINNDCGCNTNFPDNNADEPGKCQKIEEIEGSNSKRHLVYHKNQPAPTCETKSGFTNNTPTAYNAGTTGEPSLTWICDYRSFDHYSTADGSCGDWSIENNRCYQEVPASVGCGQMIRNTYTPLLDDEINCSPLGVSTTNPTPNPQTQEDNVRTYLCDYGETTVAQNTCLSSFGAPTNVLECNRSETKQISLGQSGNQNITMNYRYKMLLAPQGSRPTAEPLGVSTDNPTPHVDWIANRWTMDYGQRVDTQCVISTNWRLEEGKCIFESGITGTADAITKTYTLISPTGACLEFNGITPPAATQTSADSPQNVWRCNYGEIEQASCPSSWTGVTTDSTGHFCSSRPDSKGLYNYIFLKYMIECPEDSTLGSTAKPNPIQENGNWVCDYGNRNAIACPVAGWTATGNSCQRSDRDDVANIDFTTRFTLSPSSCPPREYEQIEYNLDNTTSDDLEGRRICLLLNQSIGESACNSQGGVIKSWNQIHNGTSYCLFKQSGQEYDVLKTIQENACPSNTSTHDEMTAVFGKLTCLQPNTVTEEDCYKIASASITTGTTRYCKYPGSNDYFYIKLIGETTTSNVCQEIGLGDQLGEYNNRTVCKVVSEQKNRNECSTFATFNNTEYCLELYRRQYKAYETFTSSTAPQCPAGMSFVKKYNNLNVCSKSGETTTSNKCTANNGIMEYGQHNCLINISDTYYRQYILVAEALKECPSNNPELIYGYTRNSGSQLYNNSGLPLCQSTTSIQENSCTSSGGNIVTINGSRMCVIPGSNMYVARPIAMAQTCATVTTPANCTCEMRNNSVFFNCKTQAAKEAAKQIERDKKLEMIQRMRGQ